MELEESIDPLDRLGRQLVLIEPIELEDVREQLRSFERSLREHLAAARPPPIPGSIVDIDHRRLRESVQQLWWFFGIVEREDHGGHRQALGQYVRLVAEGLRHHVNSEHGAPDSPRAARRAERPGVPSRNPN